MTKAHPNGRRGPPKANNPTILSNEYVERTRELLEDFGEIPVINFASFWDIKYEECIDFVALRFSGGLLRFLRENHHLFQLRKAESGFLMVSLISRPVSRVPSILNGRFMGHLTHDAPNGLNTKYRSIDRTISRIFNKTNKLWEGKPWIKLLDRKDIRIARSAYETAFAVREKQTRDMVAYIHEVFRGYTLGVKITELYLVINTMRALKIFNVSTSMVALVDELPELFYRRRKQIPENDRIFDGKTRTIQDLTGNDDEMFEGGPEPDDIVTRAIDLGLYQKTLVLIREAGVRGLKINVWMKSMKNNFYQKSQQEFDRDIGGINTLTFFLALARFDLVELESHVEFKNDIRAFLPRKWDAVDLRSKLSNLISLDSNSEEPDSNSEGPECNGNNNSDDTSNNQSLNQHVAEARSILKAQ